MSRPLDARDTCALTATTDACKKCGEQWDPYARPALRCSGECAGRVHVACLDRGGVPGSYVGDVFFELTCSQCSPFGDEVLTRDRMPWLTVIVLTLYNLREKSSGISKRGYFHWKSDISTFVDRNWDYLFKKTVKRKKNWVGTISGTLSHYGGIFFKSGTAELGESGWWRLVDGDPPEVLIAKNGKMITDRKKRGNHRPKASVKRYDSPTPSESSISVGEDSNYGGEASKSQRPSMYSRAYVQPSETLSDFLMAEDDLQDIDDLDIDDGMEPSVLCCEVPSLADSTRDFQSYRSYHGNDGGDDRVSQLLGNLSPDWMGCLASPPEDLNHGGIERCDEIERGDEEESDDDSLASARELPPLVESLFVVRKQRDWPWKANLSTDDEKRRRMSKYEEAYLLQRVERRHLKVAPPIVRRYYRKLAVRKLKRERNLPILDVDSSHARAETRSRSGDRVLDRFVNDNPTGAFELRLQGFNEPTCVHSPYTNRLLKPFIRRDASCRPLWLRVMDELLAKVNRADPDWTPPPPASVDYCYVRPQHIPAINSLCGQYFWPGIDLTECLQYPDFTCVVLYKKLVVGFAVLVPDVGYNEAYVSFLLTRAEWRAAGIGTFMLYHLIQTCMGKDVTLHVSATNHALILYQKFGFKVEEFVQDFYDKYMPPNSRDCRHALFLRLSR